MTRCRTHCPHDHELTPENTYVAPLGGARSCRICRGAAKLRFAENSVAKNSMTEVERIRTIQPSPRTMAAVARLEAADLDEHTSALEQDLAVERRLNRYLTDHTARLQRQVKTLQATLAYALTADAPNHGAAP